MVVKMMRHNLDNCSDVRSYLARWCGFFLKFPFGEVRLGQLLRNFVLCFVKKMPTSSTPHASTPSPCRLGSPCRAKGAGRTCGFLQFAAGVTAKGAPLVSPAQFSNGRYSTKANSCGFRCCESSQYLIRESSQYLIHPVNSTERGRPSAFPL